MRILLADDEAKVRSALRLLLEQQSDVAVVGEASDTWSLLAQVEALCPDLVFLDWELPGGPAREMMQMMHRMDPALLVIALSGRPEARRAALAAGANAFVSKSDPPDRVLMTLCNAGGAC